MNKFVLLFLFTIINSCTSLTESKRAPSSANDASSCRSILQQVRRLSIEVEKTKISTSGRAALWEWFQNHPDEHMIQSYIDSLAFELSDDEVALVTKNLAPGELGHDRINYLIWAAGQLPARRDRALKELIHWNDPAQTRELKKFLKARAKFDQWEHKQLQRLMADAAEDSDLSAIKAQARASRNQYERLKYACSAKVPNGANASAGKNFRRFLMTVGPMSVVAGYTVANWDELQSAWNQMQEGEGSALKGWFKQLGYDVSIGLVLSYTIGRIFSEPTGTYFQKVVRGYRADAALGIVDMFAYNLIFPQDDEEIQKRFEELKKDPQFEENMKLLQKQLDEAGFVVRFKSTVISMVKDMLGRGENFELPEAGLLTLTPADLDKPEIQKLVLKAIAVQIYEEGRYGAETPEWPATIIHTGEGGSDRLFFYASVGPLYHTVNVAIGARIYQMICMGKDNLPRAFAKAAAMHTLWSFSYNLFEFPLRTNLIGQ